MNILAFDAAAAACSAVLWQNGEVAAREWRAMARGHAETLVPMIERVMGVTRYDRLDAIAVTVGPGAFTGLRIALATARGLSLATGVPTVGVTNFEVMARIADEAFDHADTLLAVALETKRADIYLQAFGRDGNQLTPPASVAVHEVARWLPEGTLRLAVAGDAASRLIAILPTKIAVTPIAGADLPDAAIVAALAAERLGATPPPPLEKTLRPLYLRPPDATLPKAVRREDL